MIKCLWHYGVLCLGHDMTVVLLNSHGYEHSQETCMNHESSITEVEVNRDSGFDEVKKATGKRSLSCIFSLNNLNECYCFTSKTSKEMLLWFVLGTPSFYSQIKKIINHIKYKSSSGSLDAKCG